MRLLDVKTHELRSVFGSDAPPYAILSHTWGREEVTYDDLATGKARNRAGYTKLLGACAVAISEGFEYIWIDTCCIDKASSAELSEAINSMFRWYSEAEICYAFLDDVSMEARKKEKGIETYKPPGMLETSRWFSRGFTLQELIAPRHLVFYSRLWERLGNRVSLAEKIHIATSIDKASLTAMASQEPRTIPLNPYTPMPRANMELAVGHYHRLTGQLQKTSVAKRMSWAAPRSTSRPEDIAYCLLGLFNVNMPLLYGEGQMRAFHRLQEQIFRQYDDQSILAWYPAVEKGSRGWLADHPYEFWRSSGICRTPRSLGTYTVTERGLEIDSEIKLGAGNSLLLLDCYDESDLASRIAIAIKPIPGYGESDGRMILQRWGIRNTTYVLRGDLTVVEQTARRQNVFIPREPALYHIDQDPHMIVVPKRPDGFYLVAVHPQQAHNSSENFACFQFGEDSVPLAWLKFAHTASKQVFKVAVCQYHGHIKVKLWTGSLGEIQQGKIETGKQIIKDFDLSSGALGSSDQIDLTWGVQTDISETGDTKTGLTLTATGHAGVVLGHNAVELCFESQTHSNALDIRSKSKPPRSRGQSRLGWFKS